jgi:EamA domain-containing membrane protein RarD
MIERKVIGGKIWLAFVLRDLLWIGVAVRRIQIIDQSDVIVALQELAIVILLMCATFWTYRERRKRIVIGKIKADKEAEIEEAYHHGVFYESRIREA